VLTVLLYILVPKGFFPPQDTGVLQGVTEAPQTVSFASMADRQHRMAKALLEDPAVQSISSFIGVDGQNATLNSGRMLVNLKPHSTRPDMATVIEGLQQRAVAVEGVALYLQPVQDLTIEDRVSRTQYQFTLETASAADLSQWTHRLMAKLAEVPQLTDIASDLQDQGLQAYVEIDRDSAGRVGVTPAAIDTALYNAYGQRLVSTIFTQSNQYRVVLEVKPSSGRVRSRSASCTSPPAPACRCRSDRSCGSSRNRSRSRSTTSASFPRPPSRSTWRAAPRSAMRCERSSRPSATSACRSRCAPGSRAPRSRSARPSRARCG
jgi:multidrug efflux pump